ncbi:MAG: PDZ domain-containing protein [Gammaproteobacteria bacterium]|nr:PDZ domain-containing protein [Gammaproteobacteria bacterium]
MHHAMRYGAMRILYDFDESNRKVRERYTGLESGWGYAELHIAFGPDEEPAQVLCLDAQGRTIKTAQVRIRYIEPGHPAKKLDLQSGDIVLRYGDEAITDMIRFNALRNAERPGDPPKTLEIRRGEQTLQVQVPARGLGWDEKGVWVQNVP